MVHHPSTLLPNDLSAAIRNETATAECAGQLTPVQLDIIHRKRWFRLFVPEVMGGLNYSLPEAVRLEESIAWADGSIGWVVTLCAGAGMFVGYFDETLAQEVFNNDKVCLAGSGQVNGTAERTDDGYLVSGAWDYSSGAPHATHFTANCTVEDEGNSYVRSFIFERQEVSLSRNWNYTGLNATAGHSFAVNKLIIPHHRSFQIDPLQAKIPGAVYRYPFLQLAQATISVNMSGMCRYFAELAAPLIERRNNAVSLVGEAVQEMDSLRGQFYLALDESWEEHLSGVISKSQLDHVSKSSIRLAQRCRDWVDALYPYCGMEAAQSDSIINQVWRNVHTASQHTLLNGE